MLPVIIVKNSKTTFGGGKFDVSNTSLYDRCCRVLFLHGALHLFIDAAGNTRKRQNDGIYNILELFRLARGQRRTTPLFVTEGSSEQKLRSIQQSDNLTFALREFEANEKPLVVIGQSLSEEDKHLIEAIQKYGKRQVAIGIYSNDSDEVTARLAVAGLW